MESKSLDKLVNVYIYLKQQENSFIAVFLFNFKLQWKKTYNFVLSFNDDSFNWHNCVKHGKMSMLVNKTCLCLSFVKIIVPLLEWLDKTNKTICTCFICCCHFVSHFVDEWNENMISFEKCSEQTENGVLYNWCVLNFNAPEWVSWMCNAFLPLTINAFEHSIDKRKLNLMKCIFQFILNEPTSITIKNSFRDILFKKKLKNKNGSTLIEICIVDIIMMMPRPVLRVVL